jgi:hypothetical protein
LKRISTFEPDESQFGSLIEFDLNVDFNVETRTRDRQEVRIETVRISLPGLVTDAYLGIDNQTEGRRGI